jgi:hypothetical protein
MLVLQADVCVFSEHRCWHNAPSLQHGPHHACLCRTRSNCPACMQHSDPACSLCQRPRSDTLGADRCLSSMAYCMWGVREMFRCGSQPAVRAWLKHVLPSLFCLLVGCWSSSRPYQGMVGCCTMFVPASVSDGFWQHRYCRS